MSPDTPSTSTTVANAPWPGYTTPPTPPPAFPPPPPLVQQQVASKKRRHRAPATPVVHSRRQIVADQTAVEAAKERCSTTSGNDVISCFPTRGALIPQNQWATFVWNSQLPQWAQTNLVDVHLFREDTGQLILSWFNQVNPPNRRAGTVTAQVNDTWYGDQGNLWSPTSGNVTFPLYFVIVRSDQGLASGNYSPQPVFTAVQTTYADYVAASISSASVSSALSASSVAATQSPTPTGSDSTRSGSGSGTTNSSTRSRASSASPTGSIQSDGSGSSFPHWAIAVIVVLGVLAIVAAVLLAWLFMRRVRRRREQEARHSTSSGTPMLAGAAGVGGANDEPKSPLTTEDPHEKTHLAPSSAAAMGGAAGGAYVGDKHGDGASTISRAHSESAPFSGADAAIMADAFRKALRKPDFAGGLGHPEEGDTPESAKERHEAELLSRELAEEGRDIRSVASSRNVRVDHARDDGSTVEGRY